MKDKREVTFFSGKATVGVSQIIDVLGADQMTLDVEGLLDADGSASTFTIKVWGIGRRKVARQLSGFNINGWDPALTITTAGFYSVGLCRIEKVYLEISAIQDTSKVNAEATLY